MVTLMFPISSMNKVPPWAAWNKSAAIFVGAREGTAHVTEQFGFQQGFGERAAIDGDERHFRTRAIFVNGARNQFLSGAAFSGDEHAAGLRSDGSR